MRCDSVGYVQVYDLWSMRESIYHMYDSDIFMTVFICSWHYGYGMLNRPRIYIHLSPGTGVSDANTDLKMNCLRWRVVTGLDVECEHGLKADRKCYYDGFIARTLGSRKAVVVGN